MNVAKERRPTIGDTTQSKLLMANRHACCVCQKPRVQIHHIDGDPANNKISNLATLCTDHHDMASMQLGLTKKLKAVDVKKYKRSWEARCAQDLLALARDRENFYVTLYKNPPRIRELFVGLSAQAREKAVRRLAENILDEEGQKSAEKAFEFQQLPRRDRSTLASLVSAAKGQLWPEWLPRVAGHENDPDYPIDLSPPNGMTAFHGFDLYCQLLTRVLSAASTPMPLEQLLSLTKIDLINSFAGSLVNFRDRAIGKGIQVPGMYASNPTGSIQFRSKQGNHVFRARMELRTMYVFSDTAAMNLRSSRVCGIGVFGGAYSHSKNETILTVIPLLIGMGGFGQSDSSGWGWTPR